MRAVIVEDQVLLREGIAALLQDNDIEVVAMADDGPGLLRIVEGHKPDLAICDVRLPPTFTDEGIRAALEVRRRHPNLAVLVLSQDVEPAYTAELLQEGEGGMGYLLKERVSEVRTFVEAVWRVAGGGTALDREVVNTLVNERRGASRATVDSIETLSARERETLDLLAQGRTNSAIARELVVTPSAVEKHISSIFTKLDLPATDDDHRRVLAVLTYLRAIGPSPPL
jgi:DNA-binding NarL/FixJ family response regulator